MRPCWDLVDRGLETVLGFLLAGFLIFLSRGEVYGLEEWAGAVQSVHIAPYMGWFGVRGDIVGEDDTFAGESDPLRGWW